MINIIIELITFVRILLISEEKELNSLKKCDIFFVGLNVKHDSFESLLR